MDERTRRTRFEERVRIERDFLAPVNTKFGHVAPLAGMTSEAIESWASRASAAFPNRGIQKISSILREASVRATLLADHSKEVFEPAARPSPDGLAVMRKMLDEVLVEFST